jgi:hypothetical protein
MSKEIDKLRREIRFPVCKNALQYRASKRP